MTRRFRSLWQFLIIVVSSTVLGWAALTFLPGGLDLVEYMHSLIWLVAAVCSIIFYRRVGGWPALLLVVGSVAYFAIHTETRFAAYAMAHRWIPPEHLSFWQQWGFWESASGVAVLCFPIGFSWYVLRAIRGT